MFSSLLLQVPAPPASVPAWLAYVGLFALVLSVLSIVLNVIMALRKESREDGQTASQRLKKLEGTVATHDTQRQAEVTARERLGETLLREYEQLKKTTEHRCDALESKASEVQNLRERIASMEAKLDRIPEMDRKLDRLHEMIGQINSK